MRLHTEITREIHWVEWRVYGRIVIVALLVVIMVGGE